ncbi:Sor operon activator [Serratia fonticola]|uniref:Sor operon activator n=1 Tax=Serratia fonticola TaxID=47917 RepID=A0A4U9UX47_SERFO|nr:Sor operon activator [Serratia fonticola]
MSKQDEQRLLVKIATLYYVDGMKQSEIAGLLNLSQSFVSRSITRCQKEGVVKDQRYPTRQYLPVPEQAIEKQYGIRQAIVVDVDEPLPGRKSNTPLAVPLRTTWKLDCG